MCSFNDCWQTILFSEIIKSPTIEKTQKVHEIKVSENDLHWEELKKCCISREWNSCDLDFSDLRQDTDDEMLSPTVNAVNGPPPPPPGMFPAVGIPPPLPALPGLFPPTPCPDPSRSSLTESLNDSDSSTIKKNKKTVKLFWREIQDNPIPPIMRTKVGGFIWDDLPDISLDTAMLEHLFETRTNDLILKVSWWFSIFRFDILFGTWNWRFFLFFHISYIGMLLLCKILRK